MSATTDKLALEIKDLPDEEKLRLVNAILADLDKPDPEIDRIWADEARKRWAAYKAGRIPTVSYDRLGSNRLALECAKLDKAQEQKLADEGSDPKIIEF
jgi:putative addiction module component (TIGR02574 family)